MDKKNKILALIDGFNYYHKLKEYQDRYGTCVKWLDYRSLVESWLTDEDDKSNVEIIYFSAIANWRGADSVLRHKLYLEALNVANVKVVLGEFKEKKTHRCKSTEKCSNCTCQPDKKKLVRHEEKNSDVNLAITLIEKSIKGEFDKCFILSADNDFTTAISRARELNPSIKVIIQPPPLARKKPALKRDYAIDNLEHCSGNKALLTNFYTIKKHQFDSTCPFSNPWG